MPAPSAPDAKAPGIGLTPRAPPRRRNFPMTQSMTQPQAITPAITPDRIMQIGSAFAASKAFLSAVELGVFTELARQPADLGSLSWRLGLHPRSAADFLDSLVALKLLDRCGGVYRNTPEADAFLDRRKPGYIGGMLEMMNARLYGFWGSLTEALRTGKPQNEAKHDRDPDLFRSLY